VTTISDSRALRDSLGKFATGVCVVSIEDNQGVARGLTVNSFASVSLEPPLILWSLQNQSDAYTTYADAEFFSVSVLNQSQQPLSDLYAQRGDHLLQPDHCEEGASPSPSIKDSLTQFQCQTHATYPGGDHLIIVGRVLSFKSAEQSGSPLLFFGGQYGQILRG